MKEKCYISGKISNLPLQDALENFKNASIVAEKKGYESVNPMNLVNIVPKDFHLKNESEQWSWYMKQDLKLLLDCDVILMQPNWIHSKGAKIEHYIAEVMNLKVEYMDKPLIDEYIQNEEVQSILSKEAKELNNRFYRISIISVFIFLFLIFLAFMYKFFGK